MTTTDTEQEPDTPDPTAKIGGTVNRYRKSRGAQNDDAASTEETTITRPQGQRSSPSPEPQTAFGEEVIPVGEGEAGFLVMLNARYNNLAAHREYTSADRDVKAGLTRLGFYDGKAHTIRAGPFLIQIAPGEGESKDISFTREPSIRKTISRLD